VGSHQLFEVEEIVAGVLQLLDAVVFYVLLGEQLNELVAFDIESLEGTLQLNNPLLILFVLVLLRNDEVGLQLAPGQSAQHSASTALLNLLSRLELLPLRQELLDFPAYIRVIFRIVE
jgi:hypothetical protein